jgi:plasmid maintenance system antidote protein VapI
MSTYKNLARAFGVSPSNIASIVRGKTWDHV